MEQNDIAARITEVSDLAKLGWLMASAALVLFMQAGFAAIESGAVRHKNSINVALKNVIDLCISFIVFLVVGYSLMFGASIQVGGWGIIGTPAWFLHGIDTTTIAVSASTMAFFLFQVTFCNTAATIVSGGIAERCRFMAYVLLTIGISLIIYPIFGHWVWGGGWLSQIKFQDFAGSSVVHLVGAGVTLAGIQILGPRLGRFDAEGKPHRIPASSLPLVSIGVVILVFGWVGFNGGSAPLGDKTPLIIVNTLTAACFGGFATMLLIWATRGMAEADIILNGVLGGLVAVTAGANVVSPMGAAIIGILGGTSVVIGCRVMERYRLDDAVGAVPVHGFAGFVGIICVGLFCEKQLLATLEVSRGYLIMIQFVGAMTALVWSYAMGYVMWKIIGRVTSLRIGPTEEEVGMNYSEHHVEDAVLGMTRTVVDAMSGKAKLQQLDHVGDGELVALARAIRTLITKHVQHKQNAVQWAETVDNIRFQLLEQQRAGNTAATKALEELRETRENLSNLLQFMQEHTPQDKAITVMRDLVRMLHDRTENMIANVPRIIKSFDTLNASTGHLDQVAGNIRGGRV
jgi:ammonium transporter, Amt family